jgi:hypothetical protein
MSELPTVRILNWRDEVLKAWGADYNVPEVVYRFSQNREFKSTDNSDHGVYERD